MTGTRERRHQHRLRGGTRLTESHREREGQDGAAETRRDQPSGTAEADPNGDGQTEGHLKDLRQLGPNCTHVQ